MALRSSGPGKRVSTTGAVAEVIDIADSERRERDRIYVRPGDVIVEKYKVERVLGAGGMAFVVAARHLQLEEPVALKFLHKQFLNRKDVVERFSREAKAACRIKSEYVARVY